MSLVAMAEGSLCSSSLTRQSAEAVPYKDCIDKSALAHLTRTRIGFAEGHVASLPSLDVNSAFSNDVVRDLSGHE